MKAVDCDDDEIGCAINYYMVLIIVLFKYVFYIFTIKYLIVFGLQYKYINYYKLCPLGITLSSKYKIEVCFVLYYTQ
jgi:hypothetical protein